MADSEPKRNSRSPAGYDWTYEEHRRRQARRGLELTPIERLEWLETTMEEFREISGRDRGPRE